MNKNNFKGNRILKNDPIEIKPHDFGLHPLTLSLVENSSNYSMYFSKFYFNDNKLYTTTADKKLKLCSNNNNFMVLPSILIQQNDFLKIHNINDINDLIQYIDNNIDNLFDYNNRIINCFIRNNYKNLSKNNNILSNIYLKLFKNYNIDIIQVNKFIKKWFNNNNSNSFFLNLGNDLKNYLSKKYES